MRVFDRAVSGDLCLQGADTSPTSSVFPEVGFMNLSFLHKAKEARLELNKLGSSTEQGG